MKVWGGQGFGPRLLDDFVKNSRAFKVQQLAYLLERHLECGDDLLEMPVGKTSNIVKFWRRFWSRVERSLVSVCASPGLWICS